MAIDAGEGDDAINVGGTVATTVGDQPFGGGGYDACMADADDCDRDRGCRLGDLPGPLSR